MCTKFTLNPQTSLSSLQLARYCHNIGSVACTFMQCSVMPKGCASQVAQGVATSFQCSAEVDWLEETEKYYPPTVNNKETYKFAMQVGRRWVLSCSAHKTLQCHARGILCTACWSHEQPGSQT